MSAARGSVTDTSDANGVRFRLQKKRWLATNLGASELVETELEPPATVTMSCIKEPRTDAKPKGPFSAWFPARIAVVACSHHASMSDAMIVALRAQLKAVKVPGVDKTVWKMVLQELSPAATTWISKIMVPIDNVARAATILTAIEQNQVQVNPETCPAMPLRWATLATNGANPFRRLLHVTCATVCLQKCAACSDVREARSLAGQAWRHSLMAKGWCHDTALQPPIDTIQKTAKLAIDVLTVPTFAATESTTLVSLCQLVAQSEVASKALKTAATEAIADAMAKGYTRMVDLRHNAPPLGGPDADADTKAKVAATLAGHMLKYCNPQSMDPAVLRFVSVNVQVYGSVQIDESINPLEPVVALSVLSQVYSVTSTMKELGNPIELPAVPADALLA